MIDNTRPLSVSDSSQDEDAQLLWQATARAEALLECIEAGQPTAEELGALLGFLHEVVVARISEEDRYLLPSMPPALVDEATIDQLHDDHLALRGDIDDLAACASAARLDADRLTVLTRALIGRLENHLRNEAAVLSSVPGGYCAEPAEWMTAAHWYPLTEGQLIDMGQLRPDQAEDAVLNRLARLRPGEGVDVRGTGDAKRLWSRLHRREPGGYIWTERTQNHDDWLVSIERR